MQEPIEFEFGWKALNLLGKTLYSNAWNAISELVANGFDAHAKNVYVRIEAIRKDHATIEILDDGDGMNADGLSLYVKVGFNKRTYFSTTHDGQPAPSNIMGRKGIGKLAALYLSSLYYIVTKPDQDNETCWKMSFPEKPVDENEKPSLLPEKTPQLLLASQWSSISSGTLLKLQNVNLVGLNERAYEALSIKLANCFSLMQEADRHIHLCIRRKNSDPVSFQEAVKHIAFQNMAFVAMCPCNRPEERNQLMKCANMEQQIPFKKIPDRKFINKIEVFDWDPSIQSHGIFHYQDGDDGIPYVLTGWIGIHSTIKTGEAEENDEVFFKNQFYNPNQVRLYVRNKLAMENFLNVLNSTHTYSNYIEGEIHFDLLDDDNLPDIATSNRQGVDEHDERVGLLQTLVSEIISSLIKKRVALAEKIRSVEKEILETRASSAKKQFADEVDQEISQTTLSDSEKAELTNVIVGKIQGDVVPKDQHLIFISHSKTDKIFGDFIYQLLLSRGVAQDEVFYTSRDGDSKKYDDVRALGQIIKECIIRKDTLLFYLIGNDYKSSEFCMFEGGAGWATRSVREYSIMAIKHGNIPTFLTNGKLEFQLCEKGNIELSQETYVFVVHTLNRMMDHINKGRRIRRESLVSLFPEPSIPDKIQLYRERKTVQDYMESSIKECWDAIVAPALQEYVKKLNLKG